jgi:Reverse transcriptase (RNA-dependent DNA polymerase).
MIRFADDFVVLVRGTEAQAHAIKQQTAKFMAEQMRLTLSPDKTAITTLTTGLTYSGSASCGVPGMGTSASPSRSPVTERSARSCTASRR